MSEVQEPTNTDPSQRRDDTAWEVQRAFSQRCDEVLPRVRAIVRRYPELDQDLVISHVWECVWRTFPTKYREEQEAIAAGRPSPHKWHSFICNIARRRTIDHARRLGIIGRPRPSRARHIAESVAAGAALPAAAPQLPQSDKARAQSWEVPLHPDLAASADSDPLTLMIQQEDRVALRATLREALAHLEATAPRQRLALQTSLDNLPDGDAAARLETSRFGLYRLRQAAVLSLRRFFKERGYTVDTRTPSTHP